MWTRYRRLAVGCLVAALVICVIAAWLTPVEEPPVEASHKPSAAPFVDTVTIQLPTVAKTIQTEELRVELEQLGQELLSRFPDLPQALHVVAMMDAELQKTTEAAKLWRECIKLSSGDAEPLDAGPFLGLAQAQADLGQDEDAVATLQAAIAAGIANADVYEQLSVVLTKLGKLDEAAVTSQRGLELFEQTPDAWAQLGLVQVQQGQFREAESSLRQAIARGKLEPGVFFALANACARQGKQDEAATYREEFVKRSADSETGESFQERYDERLRQIAVATMTRSATVYGRHNDPVSAERLFLQAIALDPASSAACTELSTFYHHAGRIADSRVVQQRLIDIEPDIAAHYLNLASTSSLLGDYQLAEQTLRQVVSMQPDRALGSLALAQVYLQTEQFELAREHAEAALQRPSISLDESIRTHWVLAAASHELGDAAGVESALAKIRQLSPNDPRLQQFSVETP
jgi:tetratricopeptide (TPR) repeat protein